MMKQFRIMFAGDEPDVAKAKLELVKTIVGEDNVNDYGINFDNPEIFVRCTKRQFSNLAFKLDLVQYYVS